MDPDRPAIDVDELEDGLRRLLRGRRLVAELSPTTELLARVSEAMSHHTLRNPGRRIQKRFPATLVTYLVANSIFRYNPLEGGVFGNLKVRFVDNSYGPLFEAAITGLGLEPFDEFPKEGANKYTRKILAHGGIPVYCLPDFFRVLLPELRRGATDAADLVAAWRSRPAAFTNIDKPVQRFLLHGGDLAVDLLNRCIDLVHETSAGALPSAELVGLPDHIVEAYRALKIDKRLGRRSASSQVPRPRVSLDPWSAAGPSLLLPGLQSGDGSEWRVRSSNDYRHFPARRDDRIVRLDPSRSWEIELVTSGETVRHLVLGGLSADGTALFAPEGQLLVDQERTERESLLVLTTPDVVPTAVGIRRGHPTAPLRVIREAPDPTGAWDGYLVREFDIADLDQLVIGSRTCFRRRTPRPVLTGTPLQLVLSAAGRRVYSEVPTVALPATGPVGADWHVRVLAGDLWTGSAEDLISPNGMIDLSGAIAADYVGDVDLSVRGPLGSDLRAEFTVVPGLSVVTPPRLLGPADGSVELVVATTSDHRLDDTAGATHRLRVSSGTDEVSATIQGRAGQVVLRFLVRRLLWSASTAARPARALGTDPLILDSSELDDPAALLVIRTRTPGTTMRLALESGLGNQLQTTAVVNAEGDEGRWAFSLRPFADTVRLSADSRLHLVLYTGGFRTAVGQVVTAPEASGHRIVEDDDGLSLLFEERRPLKDRVARLWPLDRPWTAHLEVRVPDDEAGCAHLGVTRLPPGRYLAEVAIADDWSAPRRPKSLGPAMAILDYFPSQEERPSDALEPLSPFEQLIFTREHVRDLNPDELVVLIPIALEYVLLSIAGLARHGPSSTAFGRLVTWLRLDRRQFAEAVEETVGADRWRRHHLTGLAVRLAGRKLRGAVPEDNTLNRLWSACPALASILDDSPNRDPASERWTAATGVDVMDANEPPPLPAMIQAELASPPEVLRAMRTTMDLVPKGALNTDTRTVAMFDWLEHRGNERAVSSWLQRYGHIAETSAGGEIGRHLMARARRPGTAELGAVPQVTLAAALAVLQDRTPEATECLGDAIAWAGPLVEHDFVLGVLLTRRAETTQADTEVGLDA